MDDLINSFDSLTVTCEEINDDTSNVAYIIQKLVEDDLVSTQEMVYTDESASGAITAIAAITSAAVNVTSAAVNIAVPVAVTTAKTTVKLTAPIVKEMSKAAGAKVKQYYHALSDTTDIITSDLHKLNGAITILDSPKVGKVRHRGELNMLSYDGRVPYNASQIVGNLTNTNKVYDEICKHYQSDMEVLGKELVSVMSKLKREENDTIALGLLSGVVTNNRFKSLLRGSSVSELHSRKDSHLYSLGKLAGSKYVNFKTSTVSGSDAQDIRRFVGTTMSIKKARGLTKMLGKQSEIMVFSKSDIAKILSVIEYGNDLVVKHSRDGRNAESLLSIANQLTDTAGRIYKSSNLDKRTKQLILALASAYGNWAAKPMTSLTTNHLNTLRSAMSVCGVHMKTYELVT